MKKIIMTTTGIRILDYTRRQNQQIENMTSYYDVSCGYRKPFNGFILPKKTFASYDIDYNFLNSLFPDYEFTIDKEINIKEINKFKINNDIELTEIQKNTINKSLIYLDKHKIFISMQTGRGKTLVGIYLIAYHNVKSMIMCYSTKILKQWMKTFSNMTDMNTDRILLLHSSTLLHNILNDKIDISNYDIFISTPKLFDSFAKNNGWDKVSELFYKLNIGLKIYDEAHRNIKLMTIIDAYTNVAKTYYMSADFNQSNKEKSVLFWKMFYNAPIIDVAKDDENLTLDYIDVCCINYDSHPTLQDEMNVYTKRGFNNFLYMKYQLNTDIFYTSISTIINTVYKFDENKKYRLLILTSLIESVDIIYDYIIKNNKYDLKIGKFYGKNNDEDNENTKNNAQIIVATYSSFSVGIDATNIQFVVTCDQVDIITDNQSAGRARPIENRQAIYFMLFDKGFKKCNKSKEPRISYLYKSKARKIIDINI